MAHNPLLGDKWQGLVEKKNGVLNWTGKIKCFDDALDIRRKKPTTYFVDSKADLFHPKVPFEFIDRVFFTIYRCHKIGHTFQILTKRPRRMLKYFHGNVDARILKIFLETFPNLTSESRLTSSVVHLTNIHLGISVSTQAEADEKIPILLQISAAVRWLSIEPMLGPIDLDNVNMELLSGAVVRGTVLGSDGRYFTPGGAKGIGIDGVVVGGESGKGASPMHPDWPRNIRDQCIAANIPFYFKQWGKWLPGSHAQNFSDEQLSHYKTTLLEHNGNGVAMFRVGKKKAGSILDDWDWKQLPARAARGQRR